MILSRAKPVTEPKFTLRKEAKNEPPKLLDFIDKRDWRGAIALLEFQRHTEDFNDQTLPWLGYCYFHLGDHSKAAATYDELLKNAEPESPFHLYKACCLFFLGMYKEALEEAKQGPTTPLQIRILFHIAHKFNKEEELKSYHQKLSESTEDQLSLASVHYLRSHFQEATDTYKRLLLENREYTALNVYVALCYYKLDYYDVSLEILGVYLNNHPKSEIAINLRACNNFRLYNGKAAEAELTSVVDGNTPVASIQNPLIRHNIVVFRNGEHALQVLPDLVDVIPEARLNLVIFFLRNDQVKEGYELIKDLEPTTPQEYILKGVVNAAIGQMEENTERLKMAQQYFQLVGASASECDTIPGRQCMASCFFLLKQFEDVIIYLKSIKTYFYNDDDFNWNYGIALAASGQYRAAEETLSLVQNEKYRQDYHFLAWLARCHIMNKKPRFAWELYLKMDTSQESFSLLQLIANDCYRMGQFYFSAKAFDVLERLDPNPEYWEGKRGAAVGVFQLVIAGKEPKDSLDDVIQLLRNTTHNPQAEYIIRIMKKWAKENGVKVP
eukprot:Rmarinus@m.5735